MIASNRELPSDPDSATDGHAAFGSGWTGRRAHDRRGDSTAARTAQSARPLDAGHRRDAEQPGRRRVAHVAARLRRAGLQPAVRRSRRTTSAILRLAWSWALPNGPNEVTPLVHDGVMFVHAYGDKVQALDAATGDLLWQYLATAAARLRRHGQARHRDLRRTTLRADLRHAHRRARREDRQRRVGSGRRGLQGWLRHDRRSARRQGQGDDRHHRPRAGRQLHRRARRRDGKGSVAVLDDRAGPASRAATPGTACRSRSATAPRCGCRPATIARSTSRSSGRRRPTIPGRFATRPTKARSPTTVSTRTRRSRINVDTGKLVWFFQHQPNDQWDLDWAFERHVLPLRVNGADEDAGRDRRQAGDLRRDGGRTQVPTRSRWTSACRTSSPRSIRRPARRPSIRSLVPGDGETKFVCPHAGGAKSWLPSSYNPRTKMLYVPLVESCMDLTPVEPGGRGSLSTGVRWSLRPRPNSDGKYGRLQAINLETRTVGVDRASARAADDRHAGDGRRRGVRRRARPGVRRVRRCDGQGAVADAAWRRAEQRADQLRWRTANSTSRWSSATAARRPPRFRRSCRRSGILRIAARRLGVRTA